MAEIEATIGKPVRFIVAHYSRYESTNVILGASERKLNGRQRGNSLFKGEKDEDPENKKQVL